MSARALQFVSGLLIASVAAAAAAAEDGPLMEVPVGAPRASMPDIVRPSFPPVTAASALAMEAALVMVLRDFCIAGIANADTDAQAAARIAAFAVADPWQGQRFMWDEPRTTWSLPGTPRLFFWLGSSEIEGYRECNVLAFDGDRALLAQRALEVVEAYAKASGYGVPKYEARPLAELDERGYIDRTWSERDFSASIAQDRTDMHDIGLHVSVHARPAANAAETHRDAGGESVLP